MLNIYLFKKRVQRYYFYHNPQNFTPKIAKKDKQHEIKLFFWISRLLGDSCHSFSRIMSIRAITSSMSRSPSPLMSLFASLKLGTSLPINLSMRAVTSATSM